MAVVDCQSPLIELAGDWQRKGAIYGFSVFGSAKTGFDALEQEVTRGKHLPISLVEPGTLGLDLSDVRLGLRCMDLFSALRVDSVVNSLHLLRVVVGGEHSENPKRLAAAVQESAALTELRLSDSQVGDTGIVWFAHAMAKTLRSLHLETSGITHVGLQSLSAGLPHASHLRELNLFGNELGDQGATALASLMQSGKLPELERLNIAGCSLQDSGGKTLAESLRQSGSSLKYLNLAANAVGDLTAAALCDALVKGACLEELDMSSTEASDEAAERLGALLEEGNSTLRVLHFSGRRVTEEGIGYLMEAFENGTTLDALHLKGETVSRPATSEDVESRSFVATVSTASPGPVVRPREAEEKRNWQEELQQKMSREDKEREERVAQLNAELESLKQAALAAARKRLDVFTPNGQAAFAGIYELVENSSPNGQPLWKQVEALDSDTEERYLYSGVDGRWYFGAKEERQRKFRCSSGYLHLPEEHAGRLPYRMEGIWKWWDGMRWHDDPAIVVTTEQMKINDSNVHLKPRVLGDEISEAQIAGAGRVPLFGN